MFKIEKTKIEKKTNQTSEDSEKKQKQNTL
jgi:hypothetical protein